MAHTHARMQQYRLVTEVRATGYWSGEWGVAEQGLGVGSDARTDVRTWVRSCGRGRELRQALEWEAGRLGGWEERVKWR